MDFDSFVLAASTPDLSTEPIAREHADLIEFRMDLATDPVTAIERYDGELPILATNRADWEGGEASEDGRLEALEQATNSDAVVAIDVELESIRRETTAELLSIARERNVSVIVSAHDFDATPSRTTMNEILLEACQAGDVGKLAVYATSRSDTLSLLSVTHDLTERGERVATMSMGEIGRHTRALAPIYGSKIGYAPPDPAAETAPGQYDLATLSSLVSRLE